MTFQFQFQTILWSLLVLGNPIKSELQGSILTAGMHLCLSVVAVLYLCRQPSDNAMIFDRCLSIGWSLGAILRLRRKRRAHPIIFFIAAVCLLRFALLSALLLRSSSFVDLPPIFCVSRVLACYASVWGPEYLWTIALYWGYKIRNLLEN